MPPKRLLFNLATFSLTTLLTFIYYIQTRYTWADCRPFQPHCRIYRPHIKLAFITSYFKPAMDYQRAGEIDICLASLIANPILDQIHVLVQSEDRPLPSFAANNARTKEVAIRTRPLMGDFIQYACDHFMNHRVIFANSDIFFDSTLEYFATISDKVFDSTFYAISRWRFDKTGIDLYDPGKVDLPKGMTPSPYPEDGSYDTFAFQPRTICADKVKLVEMVSNLNYTLGVLGAENRLLYEVKRQYPGLRLENSFKRVRTVHVHESTWRSEAWKGRVDLNGKSLSIWDY